MNFLLLIQNRPSSKPKPKSKRAKMPFSPSVQHARNTDFMVECAECSKWRLVFAKTKLKKNQKEKLQTAFEGIEYTCGLLVDDIQTSSLPKDVFIKDHCCQDPIEKLYYKCEYEPICIHCGEYLHGVDEDDENYPMSGLRGRLNQKKALNIYHV